ncbi:MAG TPA: DUF4097 family beta strand repeat-containing protein [Longimicrobium sp.]|jgi:hypothetical protein|uniref:DUF4097 family beta strand repeat-containing protein n=1 Tax=Longimicrobium sp. TaxID=2029185 RepID=UPI002EDAA599
MRYVTMVAASAAVVGFWMSAHTQQAEAASTLRAPAATAGQEDFRWSGRVARGRQIEIKGLFGDVRAEPATGDEVQVTGRRRGPNAAQVRIVVDQNDEGVTICTIYPGSDGDDDRRAENDCDGDRDGDHNGTVDSDDARIDWVVRVPAGVTFSAGTIDGNITAEGLRGPVAAASVSGDVTVSTSGSARAATVSGDVIASFGEVGDEEMEFASVSGNVLLRLASGVNASVQAQTLSGQIESDFDLRRGSMTDSDDDDDNDRGGMNIDIRIGRQARGDIGRGGRELSVTTVSGDIRLERAR